VAAGTKWTEWKGLPGNANLYDSLRKEADWTTAQVTKGSASKGDVPAALASARKKLSALSLSVYEACAYWSDNGCRRRQTGRHGPNPHAQPESAGPSRRNCHDARYHPRSCDRSHPPGGRTLRPLKRWQLGCGR